MDVRQDNTTTVATGNLAGPENASATFSLKTGPLVRLSPVSLATDPETAIEGSLKIDGRLDLIDRIIGLGDDRVSGHIQATAALSGTFKDPVIQGDASVTQGSYEGTATGTTLRAVEAKAILSGDRLQLVSLTGSDGADGRLSGAGNILFAGTAASSGGIEIKLEHFTALRHPLAEAVVTGALALSGSVDSPRLAGNLKIDKADIQIPDKLPPQIVELDVVEINGQTANVISSPTASEPSLTKSYPVELDLALSFPNRTSVRGRGLNSEWKGDLTISGTTNKPILKGKLQAIRGTFDFAGKLFVVKNGSVFFPNSATEPELDVTAEATFKDLVARVEISGGLSKPTIKISSEPTLPQEDILANILFGRTTGQLSPIQAAQLARTAATLSGKGGVGIVDQVRRALGVDVLNVDSDEKSGKGASLKAGKYLTEDIFLSVTQGTKTGSQKIGVEVQVLPNVTVESDISGTADSNIGINWKWDY